jgi:predicted nuclease of restriction endonuclease-like (RecB) superfamily
MKMADFVELSEYRDWLRDLKRRIKTGQIKAAISVNSQMIALYWDLGRQIAEKQEKAKWGSGFIEQLSRDLREEFPDMTGFSKDNLLMMKRFYLFYTQKSEQAVSILETPIVEQLVQQIQTTETPHIATIEQHVPRLALIPWGHYVLLLKKVKDINQVFFYRRKHFSLT